MDEKQYLIHMPKIDLHRHLEGSIRLQTYWEEATRQGLELPTTAMETMKPYLSYTDGEERSLVQFLTKFTWLRKILTNAETLARVTYESLEDVWRDGAVYAELRFNPAGMFQMGMQEDEIASGIREGLRLASRDFGIKATTICGIARDRGLEIAERTAALSIRYAGDIISGMDLFSNEAFPAAPFQPLFEKARAAGLHLTVHAGEAQGENLGAKNVKEAILMGAERIGHGVRIMEDPSVVELAKEKQVLLEMCPTSNYQTGAVAELSNHPLPLLLKKGVHACVSTDDPAVSDTCLTTEYHVANTVLGISAKDLAATVLDSCDYLFDDSAIAPIKAIMNNYMQTTF